jgi:fucose 4-O-acetylase-like acetyltransferase
VNAQDTAAAPRKSSADRYRWMDLARGLAIVLVMVVHAGSLYRESGFDLPEWVRNTGRAMAPFRMPLLIFLSGFLLERSMSKGLTRFIYGKVRNILWPYVIWVIIFSLSVGQPEKLLGTAWLGATYLWYMLFLGAYFAVAIFVARVPYLVVAFYAIAIAYLMPDGTKYGERLFVLMGFFFLGAFAGQHLERFTQMLASRWSLALLPLAVGVSAAAAGVGGLNYSPAFAAIILPSIVAICALLCHLQDSPLLRPLQFVGRKSIVYYVMHVPIYVLTIGALTHFGVTSPYVAMATCLALGLGVATAFALAMDRNAVVAALFAAPDIVDFNKQPTARRVRGFLDDLGLLPSAARDANIRDGRDK